jgi:glucokinase
MRAIGVDIGGTKIAAGVVGPDGSVSHASTSATPRTGADAILRTVIHLTLELLDIAVRRRMEVQAVGVGTAGQVDHERGCITYANENLPGWTGTPVAERVRAAVELPVRVENDVRAMAIGESRLGAGRGFEHVLYLAVGTGIGGAIVLDGEVWRGASGTAGECGYLLAGWDRDRPIKVEETLAGPGLAARYREVTGGREALPLHEIAQRAAAGDAPAARVIRDGARRLALVLGPVLTLVDPQVLIVGGGVTGIGPLWWDSFVASLRDTPLPGLRRIPVLPAQLGAHAVMIGAAWIAMNRPTSPG